MTKTLVYYIKLWLLMSKNALLVMVTQKVVFLIFFISKLVRFGFFLGFIYFILKGTKTLAGYNINQTIFFFLTFNVVDVAAQFLFREVYRLRSQVVSGDFDITLTKPMSALFRSLVGGADIIDLATIPPLLLAVYWVGASLNPQPFQFILYFLLIINSLVVAASFHIAVLALAIITFEIDHSIMIYRDLVAMGKFPIEIYKEPIRTLLTFVIPVGVMIAVPAKEMMGLVSFKGVMLFLVLGAITLFVSMKFWKWSLRYYTSASS